MDELEHRVAVAHARREAHIRGIIMGLIISLVMYLTISAVLNAPFLGKLFTFTGGDIDTLAKQEIGNLERFTGRVMYPVIVGLGDLEGIVGAYQADTITIDPEYQTAGIMRHELCHHYLAHECSWPGGISAFEESFCNLYAYGEPQDGGLTYSQLRLRQENIQPFLECVFQSCDSEGCLDTFGRK